MYLLATNSSLYRTRNEKDGRWLEDGTVPMLPMQIIDVPTVTKPTQLNSPISLRIQACTNLRTVDKYLGNPANSQYKFRFISICQKNSWSKLQITKPMLGKLLEHHDVEPDFLEVALCFFDRMNDEEQSFCVPWTLNEDSSSIRMCYTFRYAEHKGLSPPWVIRQAGVYQKFDIRTKQSVFILLDATPNSKAHDRVVDSLSNQLLKLEQNPLYLHTVVHASYFMQWRGYLAEYERQLMPIAGTTTATFIDEPLRVTHDTLGLVRSLESRFIPIRAILVSFEEILVELETLTVALGDEGHVDPSSQQQVVARLRNWKRYSQTFARTALFLQQKSNNTATLLADTLGFRNQVVAQDQNGSMIILTRSAVFITIITLVYLPWTLITGIFGMEFFEMDTDTKQIKVSPQIWQFFAAAIGTMALTILLYCLMARFPYVRRQRKPAQGQKAERRPERQKRRSTDIERDPQDLSVKL